VFILGEDVSYGDLGAYGGGELRGAHLIEIPGRAPTAV
jgi:hypothetical protein